MVRARILIAGNVERTGYRIYVKQIARNLGVRGSISILTNGLAQIWCEGDKKQLAEFRRLIEVKSDEDNPFMMHTHAINVFVEGMPGYCGRVVKNADAEDDASKTGPDAGSESTNRGTGSGREKDKNAASETGPVSDREADGVDVVPEDAIVPPPVFGLFTIEYPQKFTPFEQEMIEMQELNTYFLCLLGRDIRSVKSMLEERMEKEDKKPIIRPRGGDSSYR